MKIIHWENGKQEIYCRSTYTSVAVELDDGCTVQLDIMVPVSGAQPTFNLRVFPEKPGIEGVSTNSTYTHITSDLPRKDNDASLNTDADYSR